MIKTILCYYYTFHGIILVAAVKSIDVKTMSS